MNIIIEKEELKRILNKVLEFLDDKIEIQEDNYWIISSDLWTDFSHQADADVGSLVDDWYFLKQLLEQDRAVSSSDLDRISSILRAISQKINPI